MDKRSRGFRRHLAIALAIACAAPATAAAASDPLLPAQWALADPAAIGAEEAWTQSSGDGVLVAVLDTGVQLDHPDLAGNIWTNSDEVPGNGRDDDANGVIDDVHGANMFDLSNNVNDDNGHGTHVAGIVAARKGNGIGGSGIAPGATIMPVKVLDKNMAGDTDALAMGIRYAVDNGARILNVSVNSDDETAAVTTAVSYAGQKGAIIVASAGNNGRNIDLVPSYPASLPDHAVFSVAASAADGLLWNLSNTGAHAVDLAAPGARISSTATGSGYQSRTGTSAAAPFVAGSLALLSAARPDMPVSDLKDAILATTKRASILSTLLGSGGRLDVGAAMHRVVGAAWRTGGPAAGAAPTLKLRTKSKARAGTKVVLRWTATGAERVTEWRVSLNGRVVSSLPATKSLISRRVKKTGRNKWRVVGLDDKGEKVVAGLRAFKVTRKR
jgi:subtilisin family serine protease